MREEEVEGGGCSNSPYVLDLAGTWLSQDSWVPCDASASFPTKPCNIIGYRSENWKLFDFWDFGGFNDLATQKERNSPFAHLR